MKVAVMGYGTIGSGVVEVLEVNKDLITSRVGKPVEVKYILDLRDFPPPHHFGPTPIDVFQHPRDSR